MTRAALIAALDLSRLLVRLTHGRFQIGGDDRHFLRVTIARAMACLCGRDLPAPQYQAPLAVDEETGRACFDAIVETLAAGGISNATMVGWFNDTAIERVGGEHAAHR